MSLSNSFHSSAKKHAISGAGKLARVERHNSRGYFSFHYDQDKVHALIGEPTELADDVRRYIDETFAGCIDAYNAKQTRKDRKISDTPFEYFNANKSLDIANETIFQLGDQEFWSRYRKDTVIQTKKGERVIRDFSEDVQKVMDEIFTKQMDAFEKIYETDNHTILKKIQTEKESAAAYLAGLPEDLTKTYQLIQKEKSTAQRTRMIHALEDPDGYLKYTEATERLAMIKKMKLIERIEAGQMHIKLINGTAHYDESSPHAHGVSVCWTEGYSTGVGSRIAKTAVLNPWALSVIQDKLREIAKEAMRQHPEIFQGESLAEKQRGRNLDYSAEQIARQKQRQLLQDIEQGTALVNTIKTEAKEYINAYRAESDDLQAEISRLQEDKNLIQSYEEYDYEVTDIDRKIDGWAEELDDILDVAQETHTPAPLVERLLNGVLKIMEDAAAALRRRIDRIHIFEQIHNVLFPNSKRLHKNLDDVIAGARTGQAPELEHREQRSELDDR